MSKKPLILAADDNEDALFALKEILDVAGFDVQTAINGKEAVEKAKQFNPDLILLDLVMPKMNGYEATQVLKADPELRYTPVVLVTSKDNLEDIVMGLNYGADDYIKKPFRKEELLARINAAMRMRALYQDLQQSHADNRRLRLELKEGAEFEGIIGSSASMREIYALIDKIKESDVSVLITGESGTGKELIARAIHTTGQRKNRAFVAQNCSAFNDNLLESELFGHVKGAFTGATRDKQGLFEVADGGSFFLDELGEMSPALQVKLLRVLQDGTFIPVGATAAKKVDVRVIAATNRDLREMVKKGLFREDLFYRLNVVNIALPPLRERRVDIPLLAQFFLQQIAAKNGTKCKVLSEESLRVLSDYDWPGNVRELQNELERAVIMSGHVEEISLVDISKHLQKTDSSDETRGKRLDGKLKDAIENLEKNMIAAALDRHNGNKSEAAKDLGLSRSTLISKVANYQL
ncbi:MAG: sigma-54-dependent transcriptional regulator [Bdellovibrionota bacterium]|jgi:two-component system response regulator HupR/HoxA